MEQKGLLTRIRRTVQAQREGILDVGQFLYANPETGFKERLAARRITAFLKGLGFEIQAPYAGIETAFRASIRSGRGRQVIAVLAEYDALEGIGHACGHNLITTAALAAAAGMAGCRELWRGRFEVIGTPAEEMLAGKCVMADRGAFDHLDACFMTHPWTESCITLGSNALRSFTATFHGKAAHAAAAPAEGVNALDAALLFFNAIHAMRQHLREDARIHGIVTEGGRAVNVIPERAQVCIGVRALDERYVADLERRVVRACRAAARSVGARVRIRADPHAYRPFRHNAPLDRLLTECYARAGIELRQGEGMEFRGSLDMGNVSQLVPAAHPFFNIFGKGVQTASPHTRGFLEQAALPYACAEAVKAGEGMALAAARLLSDRGTMRAVKKAS